MKKLLSDAHDKLDRLAETLLSHESVSYNALIELLEPPAHLVTGDNHA